MQQLTYWYLEAQAHKLDGNFFVKEIAILKGDRTQCFTYYIHHHSLPLPTSQEYQDQKSKLRLAWTYGEHTFEEAIALIKEIKQQMSQVFEMKDLGELRYCLGLEISRDSGQTFMS